MRTCRRQQYDIFGEWMHYELFLSSIAFSQSKKSRRGRNKCEIQLLIKKKVTESGTAKSNLLQT